VLNVARLVFFAYSVLMIVGGIAGYVEAKSIISLIAGVVCGLLALAGGIYITSNPTVGLVLGIVAAVLAGGGMGPRYMKAEQKKVWPGGIVLIASALTLVVGVAAFAAPKGTGSPTPPVGSR
jgi:uncharacterized membrane protein (UPF0136 family)